MTLPLVILHGGNGSAETMRPLFERLPAEWRVAVPNMIGHGGRPVPDGHSLDEIVADLLAQLDAENVGRADFFGYSFGGFVGLYLAAHHPERVRTVTTLAAKFDYDDRTIAHLTHLVDPERLAREGSPRAAELTVTHHPQDWVAVAKNNRALYASFRDNPPLGRAEMRAVAAHALLLAGLSDPIVSADETRLIGKLLPNARVRLFPGSSHPLHAAPLGGIVGELTRFLADPETAVAADRIDLLSFRIPGGLG